jgi:transposase InsO family protein
LVRDNKRVLVNRQSWKTVVELSMAIADYIETFYNPTRRHSSLDPGRILIKAVNRIASGCRDLNPGPLDPQSSALTKLRHSPLLVRGPLPSCGPLSK